MADNPTPTPAPSGGYGKHSKKFWIVVYIVAAIIIYGLAYLIFFHKSGATSGGGFNY